MRHLLLTATIFVSLLVSVSVASPSAAQSQDDPAKSAAARAFFQDAVTAADAGDFEKAVDLLERALELNPD